jgi:exodeoxyribonuclease-3
MSLSLLTLNVGAPSLERARRQLEWIAARPEDIFVLTETKATPGSQLLAEGCTAANYSVTFPAYDPGELGVMIISKVTTTPDSLTGALSYLPARAAGVIIATSDGPLRVLGPNTASSSPRSSMTSTAPSPTGTA